MVTKIIVILAVAAGTAGVYSAAAHKADDALPCVEGAPVPQIVVTAKREQ